MKNIQNILIGLLIGIFLSFAVFTVWYGVKTIKTMNAYSERVSTVEIYLGTLIQSDVLPSVQDLQASQNVE